MAKSSNYKLKLLYLAKLFMEETDEEHPVTVNDIKKYLEGSNISADRKTLYTDFESLRDCGFDIICEHDGRKYYYYLGSRDFELPELKLLVDSVQSAKFLTEKRSRELIKKLERLTSKPQAKKLQRQVLIAGRVKSINEKIYYNVDKLHEAIGEDSQITFYYSQWTVEKTMQFKRDGNLYKTSPWALMWDDENYYLVGFDAEEQIVKHYRVDKMSSISLLHEKREGKKQFKDKTTLVFGSEGNGLSEEMLEAVDDVREIESFGSTRSVNVGVAAGIAMYEWVRQRKL